MKINLRGVRDNITKIRMQGGSDADVSEYVDTLNVPMEVVQGDAPYYRDAAEAKKEAKAAPIEFEKPTRLARIGRGAMDVAQGAGQLVRGDEYDRQVAGELGLWDRAAGEGFDAYRLVGQAAPFAVAGVAGGGALAARLAARGVPGAVTAAGAGALEGGMLATKTPGERVNNAVLGAVGGAGAYGLARGATKLGSTMAAVRRQLSWPKTTIILAGVRGDVYRYFLGLTLALPTVLPSAALRR